MNKTCRRDKSVSVSPCFNSFPLELLFIAIADDLDFVTGLELPFEQFHGRRIVDYYCARAADPPISRPARKTSTPPTTA
jgi:hypothetical protein